MLSHFGAPWSFHFLSKVMLEHEEKGNRTFRVDLVY